MSNYVIVRGCNREFDLFRACFIFLMITLQLGAQEADVPTAYKGRFRSLEAYARLWLNDLYHHQALKKEHLPQFHTTSTAALDLLWDLHFRGHAPWDEAPLFWIHHAAFKSSLGLNPNEDYFSYKQLNQAIISSPQTIHRVLIYHFFKSYLDPSNRGRSEKLELTALAPNLWLAFQGDRLVLLAAPNTPPWNRLKAGDVILENARSTAHEGLKSNKLIAEEYSHLIGSLSRFEQFRAGPVAPGTPLSQAGSTLLLLPNRYQPGEWLSLKTLSLKNNDLTSPSNFTTYPDPLFANIRSLYIQLEEAYLQQKTTEITPLRTQLSQALIEGYLPLAGTPYREAFGKALFYPSLNQLKAETFYYHYPITWLCVLFYCLACCFLLWGWSLNRSILNISGLTWLVVAFSLHTILLCLRVFILKRPPVSNMFETVVYVPWVAVLTSLIIRCIYSNALIPMAASLLATALLIVLQLTHVNASMDTVQAVLDSQYWLIVHVLMVVGSYGIFLLCGVLGHLYLIGFLVGRCSASTLEFLGKFILQTMYFGVALLIPGTILGGIWAAESWGRFWDWDPKEAWAFISCCVYLIWIHAYRFQRIRHFGLAVGAVVGLQTIAFTWYGVNYILGTGLHSYGFGSGGEMYFYLFMAIEFLFLILVGIRYRQQNKTFRQNHD